MMQQWKVQLLVRRMYGGAELAGSPSWMKIYVSAGSAKEALRIARSRLDQKAIVRWLPPEAV